LEENKLPIQWEASTLFFERELNRVIRDGKSRTATGLTRARERFEVLLDVLSSATIRVDHDLLEMKVNEAFSAVKRRKTKGSRPWFRKTKPALGNIKKQRKLYPQAR